MVSTARLLQCWDCGSQCGHHSWVLKKREAQLSPSPQLAASTTTSVSHFTHSGPCCPEGRHSREGDSSMRLWHVKWIFGKERNRPDMPKVLSEGAHCCCPSSGVWLERLYAMTSSGSFRVTNTALLLLAACQAGAVGIETQTLLSSRIISL